MSKYDSVYDAMLNIAIKGSDEIADLKLQKKVLTTVEDICSKMKLPSVELRGILDDNSPREEHEKYAAEALKICREKIFSEKYDVVILDEVNYAINLGLLDVKEIIELIKEKPEKLDLVLTGNHAKEEIIELADLVTEMKEIKHPFKSGIKAKKGIDF